MLTRNVTDTDDYRPYTLRLPSVVISPRPEGVEAIYLELCLSVPPIETTLSISMVPPQSMAMHLYLRDACTNVYDIHQDSIVYG